MDIQDICVLFNTSAHRPMISSKQKVWLKNLPAIKMNKYKLLKVQFWFDLNALDILHQMSGNWEIWLRLNNSHQIKRPRTRMAKRLNSNALFIGQEYYRGKAVSVIGLDLVKAMAYAGYHSHQCLWELRSSKNQNFPK